MIKIQVSLREKLILPVKEQPQIDPELFQAPAIQTRFYPCLVQEAVVSEKVRSHRNVPKFVTFMTSLKFHGNSTATGYVRLPSSSCGRAIRKISITTA